MKILIRGIPNFSYLTEVQVDNLDDYLAAHTVQFRGALLGGHQANYFNSDGKRVLLYLEGISENSEVLLKHSLNPEYRRSVSTMYIKPNAEMRLGASGSDSSLSLDSGLFYLLDPVNDPRHPNILAEFKASDKIERAERARLEDIAEQEEALRIQTLDYLFSRIGHQAVMELLKKTP